jgi:hypothetical protein
MSPLHTVDHAAIKTGQILAIATLAAAFVLDRWEPVAALAAVFLITATAWRYGPFFLVYQLILVPLKLVRPDVRHDNIQPHRFGQAVGAASALLAAAALYSGHHTVGWVLVGILIALTAVSFMGWCIGCFIYYQLNRLGLGGFFARAPTDRDVPLGARPRKDSRTRRP